MKILLITLLWAGLFTGLQAQTQNFNSDAFVKPYHLEITVHKTTILIFPSAIKSADRGDSYILATKVSGAENILKVKAAKPDFTASNLNVVTADGKVYSFDVHYALQPAQLTIDLGKQRPNLASVKFNRGGLNAQELEFYCGAVAIQDPLFQKGKYSQYGLDFYLQGIYIKNDVLFFSYRLKNNIHIRYDLESLRFFIRDKKKSKRTAVQDRETRPLYIFYKGVPEEVRGQTIVVAFPKFTIAQDKFLASELTELGGDRNPASKLDQALISKSKILH